MQTITFWKLVQTTAKKSSKFAKKITHVDDMMIHNLVKHFVQTRLRLWDIKTTNFKPTSCPDDLLEICYFNISQTKLSLDKIFYKVMYHHIIYMWDFFVNLDNFFVMVCMSFHKNLVFTRYVPIKICVWVYKMLRLQGIKIEETSHENLN